ncbi:hypothetical protein EAE99_006950 [Botrytis elliptica]|nr:hypothetical protein EAE99_006950 [Botrytis elliptica]
MSNAADQTPHQKRRGTQPSDHRVSVEEYVAAAERERENDERYEDLENEFQAGKLVSLSILTSLDPVIDGKHRRDWREVEKNFNHQIGGFFFNLRRSATTICNPISQRMQFLDLAPELVHHILLEAVLTRGIHRSITLRLVCKRFYHDVQFALFKSHLLDDYETHSLLYLWHFDSNKLATFWHSYLVYRVQNNSDSCPPHFRHIRRLVETLCAETGDEVENTIEKLCWPILSTATDCANSNLIDLNFELDLLCAATYLNIIPVVKRLLQGGYPPRSERDLFDPPVTLAALAGNKDLLEYLQSIVLETQSIDDLEVCQWNSIIGAAMSGDIEMVRIALYPPSWSTFDFTHFIDGPFVPQESLAEKCLLEAQVSTGNLEMYKYLEGFFPRPAKCPRLGHLMFHIQWGNSEIVKYILDTTGTFFCGAQCCGGAKLQDIIDLLFEYGFDTNYFSCLEGQQSEWLGDETTSIEAQKRNMVLVHKLFDHGASIYDIRTAETTLEWAVSREDTVMVGIILASGIDLASCGGRMLKLAVTLGLDSMEDILQAEFFKLSIPQRARWMMISDGRIDPEKHEQ